MSGVYEAGLQLLLLLLLMMMMMTMTTLQRCCSEHKINTQADGDTDHRGTEKGLCRCDGSRGCGLLRRFDALMEEDEEDEEDEEGKGRHADKAGGHDHWQST